MADSRLKFVVVDHKARCLSVLKDAEKFIEANDCDEIVVVIQKRVGGSQWYAPPESTIATTMFLLQTFLFHLNCIIREKGING